MKWRAVISLMTSLMFVVMAFTGLVLFIVPQGRIAYWVDWRFWGLGKTAWGDIHIVSSVFFVVAGAWHLYYNWKPLLGYLRSKAQKGVRVRRELLITGTLTILLTAGAILRVPPVSYLLDLNAHIKASWIGGEDEEPPFGHAELLSLKSFCKKTDIDLAGARGVLDQRGIKLESEDQTLESIAESNGISPRDVFVMIKDLAVTSPPLRKDRLSADEVFERFEGTGVGRLTLDEACLKGDQKPATCNARLDGRGIEVQVGETVKQLAEREGVQPIKIMQIMLVDD